MSLSPRLAKLLKRKRTRFRPSWTYLHGDDKACAKHYQYAVDAAEWFLHNQFYQQALDAAVIVLGCESLVGQDRTQKIAFFQKIAREVVACTGLKTPDLLHALTEGFSDVACGTINETSAFKDFTSIGQDWTGYMRIICDQEGGKKAATESTIQVLETIADWVEPYVVNSTIVFDGDEAWDNNAKRDLFQTILAGAREQKLRINANRMA